MVVSLLAAALAQCCAQHKVAPGLVGTASDLKSLVRWYTQDQPEAERPELAQGWRHEVCGAPLVDVLAGHVALRVVDPRSDVPVTLEPPQSPSS
jgi:ribonuclease D